jgi:hypothetical protein
MEKKEEKLVAQAPRVQDHCLLLTRTSSPPGGGCEGKAYASSCHGRRVRLRRNARQDERTDKKEKSCALIARDKAASMPQLTCQD